MGLKKTPTIVHILQGHANQRPDKTAIVFLAEDGAGWESRTYAELDRQARAVAAALSAQAEPGDRALILCPPGLAFAGAILGCFYAGVVAVPAYPPGNARQTHRIDAIWRDAEAVLIVTTVAVKERIETWLADEGRRPFRYLCVDETGTGQAGPWKMSGLHADSLAFLQYTSGSTSEPKGVMVSHGNLTANLSMIRERFGLDEDMVVGSWLPMFHDMGLVGNLLEPLYLGAKTVLMSPVAFVRKPVRWLELIARHRVDVTGAPNFGYGLCVDRISEAQRQPLDLSSLKIAYCGSEPIDDRVLSRFSAMFRPAGFDSKAFYPCYGMAEATLLVTGSVKGGGAAHLPLDAEALAAGRALPAQDGSAARRVLVGCGYSMPGQELRIIDPETGRELPEGHVGEVWLKGPHVAQGYWRKKALSEELFNASVAGSGEGPYLRTGDLAFLRGGNLFVAGRIKDVIIVRGRNYYPQDIERTAAASHSALQPEGGAAFSVDIDGEPKIVVVQEVRRTAVRGLSAEAVASDLRRAIFDQHELAVHALALLKPASLPKTSSGKIRRGACRAAFLDGSLEALYAWRQPSAAGTPPSDEKGRPMLHWQTGNPPGGAPGHDTGSRQRADQAIAWLRAYAESRIDSRLIDERRAIPPYIVLDFGNQGLLGLQAPTAAGGLGLSHRDAYRVLEQLAAIDPTLVSFVGVHNALGLRPLLRFGSDAQKQALLPAVAQGRELASFAFTEPGAGSNPTAIESVAIPDGRGGWRLRGEKKWIGTAAWAGYVHVFAHLLDEQGRRRGLAGFIVRQGAPGFVQGPEELTMGMRGMVQNTVYLRDVAVGPEDLLGTPGQGMLIAQDIMESGRVGIAAVALGVMKRSAQLMARYAGRRTMATGRLIDNVISRDRLTQLTVETAALEALLYAFADWLDESREVPKEYYAAIKVLAAEAAFRAVDAAMQMVGARGYIETNMLPQMLRDVRLLRIFEGPSETMQMFVGARLAAGSPAFSAFLRETIGAEELAGQLEDAALTLKSRALADTQDGADNWQDGQRIAQLLGEAGAWALWLAVVERAARMSADSRLASAQAWLRQRQATSLAEALRAQPGLSQPLSGHEIEAIVAAYADQIGDVQQYRPATLESLDPLLRRDASAPPDTSPGTLETTPAAVPAAIASANDADRQESRAIEQWIQQWIAGRMGQNRAEIAATKPFADFGLDSLTAMELTEQLEKWLGLPISPTATWDFPNIKALAAHLAAERRGTETPPAAAASGQEPKPAAPDAALDALSDSELAALLAGELGTPH